MYLVRSTLGYTGAYSGNAPVITLGVLEFLLFVCPATYSGGTRIYTLLCIWARTPGMPLYFLRGHTGTFSGGTWLPTLGIPRYILGVPVFILRGYRGAYSGDTRVHTLGVPRYILPGVPRYILW